MRATTPSTAAEAGRKGTAPTSELLKRACQPTATLGLLARLKQMAGAQAWATRIFGISRGAGAQPSWAAPADVERTTRVATRTLTGCIARNTLYTGGLTVPQPVSGSELSEFVRMLAHAGTRHPRRLIQLPGWARPYMRSHARAKTIGWPG